MNPNSNPSGDMLSNAPKNTTPPAVSTVWNDDGSRKDLPSSVERYASTDEMRAEFGDYRVNAKVENLCDSSENDEIDAVPFPPLKNQSPFNEQSETPEGN